MKTILCLVACVALALGCSKSQPEYQAAVASAQSRDVFICYEDGFWGALDDLRITVPAFGLEVPCTPSTFKLDGVESKCLRLTIPLPDSRQMMWNEDMTISTGSVEVDFKSPDVNLTLSFGFEMNVRRDVPGYFVGNSSIAVSSVSNGTSVILREGNTFSDRFVFHISSLVTTH